MEFRPCIDIHNGWVKQIVGSSLCDEENQAKENYVAGHDADYYARLYKRDGLRNGHVILLNPKSSIYYEKTQRQALLALQAYPGGLQVGGGITDENAAFFLEQGASHVIVTSYVFQDGRIQEQNLNRLLSETGKEHLVLDLSCRFREDGYYIVTDRWQKFTEEKITGALLEQLSGYCDEFLIHAADAEGKCAGIETGLIDRLAAWNQIPITYAGGIHSFADLENIRTVGKNKIHVTIGSGLDLFGGGMKYEEVCSFVRNM